MTAGRGWRPSTGQHCPVQTQTRIPAAWHRGSCSKQWGTWGGLKGVPVQGINIKEHIHAALRTPKAYLRKKPHHVRNNETIQSNIKHAQVCCAFTALKNFLTSSTNEFTVCIHLLHKNMYAYLCNEITNDISLHCQDCCSFLFLILVKKISTTL